MSNYTPNPSAQNGYDDIESLADELLEAFEDERD